MQRAVHQQMRVVGLQGLALLFGLTCDDRGAQHQVGGDDGRLRVVKGQHIGGVVFAAVVAVQGLPFICIDDAHGDFGVGFQRVANPPRDAVAGQGGAVAGQQSYGGQLAELQRQSQVFEHS